MQDGLLITIAIFSGLTFVTSAATLGVMVYGGKKAQDKIDKTVFAANEKKDMLTNELKAFAANLGRILD